MERSKSKFYRKNLKKIIIVIKTIFRSVDTFVHYGEHPSDYFYQVFKC